MADNYNITPKLDPVPLTKFRDELEKSIKTGEIYGDGWEIKVRRYNIPWMGENAHTALELHGPKREDGTRFYASLDTYTYNNKGENMGYMPGAEMRITTDMQRNGNYVTKDENILQDLTLAKGSGIDMLGRFTLMGEQATEFNSSGAQYHPFSWDGYLGMGNKEWANSNSGPRQILDNLGYNTNSVDGVNLKATEINTGYVFDHDAPGADDDVSSLFPQKTPGHFEQYFKDGKPSVGLIDNPQEKERMLDMFTRLHPDFIAVNDPEMKSAPTAAPKP